MAGKRPTAEVGKMRVDPEAVMAPVVANKLRKEFDGLVAVDDLDMNIGRGLLYGLIGPNGSGKTTAIKMFVGLLRPTSGQAQLLGEGVPLRKNIRRIGYMPQELAIYLDLTVHENLELFATSIL
jgi:ABC-2 type transport system ATP-binding protein